MSSAVSATPAAKRPWSVFLLDYSAVSATSVILEVSAGERGGRHGDGLDLQDVREAQCATPFWHEQLGTSGADFAVTADQVVATRPITVAAIAKHSH
jgi:hypothetical protein